MGLSAPISRRRVLALGAGLGAMLLVGGLACRRVREPEQALSDRERLLVDTLCATLYPGSPGPRGDAVGAADFMERYFREGLEPSSAQAMRSMLTAIEWGAVLAAGGRFSRLPHADRVAYLGALERHGLSLVRSAVFGLKTVLGMAYFEHPAAREAAGVVRICEAPA